MRISKERRETLFEASRIALHYLEALMARHSDGHSTGKDMPKVQGVWEQLGRVSETLRVPGAVDLDIAAIETLLDGIALATVHYTGLMYVEISGFGTPYKVGEPKTYLRILKEAHEILRGGDHDRHR